jgi:4-oxalocrotonate tautomerase
MPIINVKISLAKSPQNTERISELLLEGTTRILRKKRELTAITIDYVDPADWVVGGSTLAAQGKHSFYFDIKVVDETNTKAEKSQYISEVFAAFEKLLGNIHPESYIYVQDVRASAYGLAGRRRSFAISIRPEYSVRPELGRRAALASTSSARTVFAQALIGTILSVPVAPKACSRSKAN